MQGRQGRFGPSTLQYRANFASTTTILTLAFTEDTTENCSVTDDGVGWAGQAVAPPRPCPEVQGVVIGGRVRHIVADGIVATKL